MEAWPCAALEWGQLVLVGCLLVVAAARDLRARVIPNRVVLAVCALWALGLAAGALGGAGVLSALACSLAGALAALVPLVVVAVLAGGVGGGDVKLLGALGLVLGPVPTLALMVLSCALELAFALLRYLVFAFDGRLVEHKSSFWSHALPFAPFIALAYPLAAIIRCYC